MTNVQKLAESLKISKVTVYKVLNHRLKDQLKGHVFKDAKQVTVIDEIGEALIRDYFGREQAETVRDILEDLPVTIENGAEKTGDIIEILRQQIQEKDEQIKSLLDIVTNQQKLQMTQLITTSQLEEAKKEKEEKPGMFSKVFKRRRM